MVDADVHVCRRIQRTILIGELISAPKEEDLEVAQIELVLEVLLVVGEARESLVGHGGQLFSVGAIKINGVDVLVVFEEK